MKNYQKLNEMDETKATQGQLDTLRIFQYLFRNNAELNARYPDRGLAIADGLQPWIDALEVILKKGNSSLE